MNKEPVRVIGELIDVKGYAVRAMRSVVIENHYAAGHQPWPDPFQTFGGGLVNIDIHVREADSRLRNPAGG